MRIDLQRTIKLRLSKAARLQQAERDAAAAEQAFEARDFMTAAEGFAAAARWAPDRAELWYRRGESLKLSGFLAEAVGAFHQAAALRPRDPAPLLALGAVLAAQGRLSEAGAAFEAAVVLDPEAQVIAENLEMALQDAPEAGPPLPAIPPAWASFWDRMRLKFLPSVRKAADGAVRRGDEARDARDWIAAAFAYAEGLSLDPSLAHIWVQFGHALKEARDLHGAEAAYRTALVRDPANADTFLMLGHALKLQNRMVDAASAYIRALELEPGSADGVREVAGLARDGLSLDLSRLAAALEGERRAATPLVLHISGLVARMTADELTEVDKASLALVSDLLDGGDGVAICETSRKAAGLRNLPLGLVADAARMCLAEKRDDGRWADVRRLLTIASGSGSLCEFGDGAVLVDFGDGERRGDYDLQMRAVRRERNVHTVAYVPEFGAPSPSARPDADVLAAIVQSRAVLVDFEGNRRRIINWAGDRGVRIDEAVVFTLDDERDGATRAARLLTLARRLSPRPKPAPAPPLASDGVYYGLSTGEASASGPRFRSGEGWWQPEAWGCWTRPDGGSLLFTPQSRGQLDVYVGLRGLPDAECPFRIEADGAAPVGGVLQPGQTYWKQVAISAPEAVVRISVSGLTEHLLNPGARPASVGVIGFMVRAQAAQAQLAVAS